MSQNRGRPPQKSVNQFLHDLCQTAVSGKAIKDVDRREIHLSRSTSKKSTGKEIIRAFIACVVVILIPACIAFYSYTGKPELLPILAVLAFAFKQMIRYYFPRSKKPAGLN